jgi:hypothetical protein
MRFLNADALTEAVLKPPARQQRWADITPGLPNDSL